jgi:hypothetical protein
MSYFKRHGQTDAYVPTFIYKNIYFYSKVGIEASVCLCFLPRRPHG